MIMVIVSVDDHISANHLTFSTSNCRGDALARPRPNCRRTKTGTDYWDYQGMKMPSVGLNAVVGRVPEEYGIEPTALSQLRKGCFDAKARLADMDVNGIAASLNFGTAVGFDGGVFHRAKDKTLSLVHLRAYNNWHIDEWCGAHPARFIPCGICCQLWDMDATVG